MWDTSPPVQRLFKRTNYAGMRTMKSALPLLALAMLAPPGSGEGQVEGQVENRVTIHQRIVIRVPRMTPVKPIEWRERGTDQCQPIAGLAGASFVKAGTVDLFFTDGRRIRALLGNKCTAIDFYSGFYIRPPVDGRVCARRDPARSRSGAVCEIRAFKRLVPKR